MRSEEEEWFSMPGRGGEDREDEPEEEESSSSSSSEEWGSKEREESTSSPSPSMVEEPVVLKRSRVGVSDSGVSMSSSVGSSKEGDTVPLLKPLSGAMIVSGCRDFLVECEGGFGVYEAASSIESINPSFPSPQRV